MKICYLIRKLTIIFNDGQFSNYKLVYLTGEADGNHLSNISICPFEKELSKAIFKEYMTLKEGADHRWKII